jgi:protein-S-isoprenylcysteine O-methyltransferase Ste14
MLGFGVVELFLRQGQAAKKITPTPTDRGTTLLLVTAYLLAVLATSSNLLPTLDLGPVVGWAGVGVGVSGFGFRVWAMRVLGRYYTRTLVATLDQRVVRQGPYRVIRHPGYLGSILVWTGAAASSENLFSILAVMILLAIAYTYRIRTEERMLVETLGKTYMDYRKESWRLLPFVF